jgi:hypothetical protein
VTQGVRIRYFLDMVDAEEPEFLNRVRAFVRDPSNPVNHADLRPISEDAWLRVPDLSQQEFTIGRP